MSLPIGENIRRLRRQRAITQEQLAEYLDVSFQSISRWERGECCPEIAALPGIAHFFGVSVDELLGVDRMRRPNHLSDLFAQAHRHFKRRRFDEAEALLRDGLRDFPGHHSLMSELALVLTAMALDRPSSPCDDRLREAIALSQRVLSHSANEKVKSTTRANLCLLYERAGEREKARQLAGTIAHLWESREWVLMQIADDLPTKRQMILTALAALCQSIEASFSAPSAQTQIALGPAAEQPSPERIEQMLRMIGEAIAQAPQ